MHRIFQERPEILNPVFSVLGIELPEKATVDVITTDVTETRPLERRVDTLLRIGPSDGEDFLLAIEAQERKDVKKESSWAYYIAYLQAKYGLPVLLLVVCRNAPTAKWAVGPFNCGARGWTVQQTRPMVAGPHNLPVITDARTVSEKPALAALCALAHANGPHMDAILNAMGRALEPMDGKASSYVYQFLEITLGNSPAGRKWRKIMSFVNYFPGQGTLLEKALLEGEARGEARGILRVLEVRGLEISDEVREHITACADLDNLNDWLERAGTVSRAEDLFVEAEEEA
ncbi:hypothetical protein [Streptomyces sp. NPDC096132]|uniref:hypothetical protein n=1 Tax=Streptomyces sp. NPDC096132 TaxID=3366075 RepID=UPI0038016D90